MAEYEAAPRPRGPKPRSSRRVRLAKEAAEEAAPKPPAKTKAKAKAKPGAKSGAKKKKAAPRGKLSDWLEDQRQHSGRST